MNASLRALLTGLIDYAGLFPPAQLQLEPALANDAAYRSGPDAWMLGRFVCPAARLKELTAFPPLSVVGRGGATAAELGVGQHQDLGDIHALRRHHPGARVDAYELRLSNELLRPDRGAALRTAVTTMGGTAPTSFFEVEYGSNWMASVEFVIRALAEDKSHRNGLKIRCGGATAAHVPSVDDLAGALALCCKAGVPAKFTAGLHHPVRHLDAALGTKTHGFLNVFVAGVFCHARKISSESLRAILTEEDAAQFHFDDAALRWKDVSASTKEVAAARKKAVISFGSCSFDEPREDLRTLGLLDR
jgi:hypothetical protein